MRVVYVCSESMNDVTDNATNNFADPLDVMYIACARSVSENVGLLLRNLYVVSYKFELVLFRGNAFCPLLTCNCNGFFWYSKKRGLDPPLDPPMVDINVECIAGCLERRRRQIK